VKEAIGDSKLADFQKVQGKAWPEKLLTLCAAYGTDHKNDAPSYGGFEGWAKPNWAKQMEDLWDSVSDVLMGSLNYFRVSDVEEAEVKGVADMIGMDWAKLVKDAEAALPEPASWAAERGEVKKPDAKAKAPKNTKEWSAQQKLAKAAAKKAKKK